jgi:mono/diheme cytochrome c family protein
MRAALFILPSLFIAGVAGAVEPSAEAGRALFIGTRPFQAGGAPCGACHALGGEGVSFTASLGPELSTSLATMDPDALAGLRPSGRTSPPS